MLRRPKNVRKNGSTGARQQDYLLLLLFIYPFFFTGFKMVNVKYNIGLEPSFRGIVLLRILHWSMFPMCSVRHADENQTGPKSCPQVPVLLFFFFSSLLYLFIFYRFKKGWHQSLRGSTAWRILFYTMLHILLAYWHWYFLILFHTTYACVFFSVYLLSAYR